MLICFYVVNLNCSYGFETRSANHMMISMRSLLRVIFNCGELSAACASFNPDDNLNDKVTVWLLNITSNLWERKIKIKTHMKSCWFKKNYSESMHISGCRPVAFWITKNSFVITSITCAVWKTKSPFFRPSSD